MGFKKEVKIMPTEVVVITCDRCDKVITGNDYAEAHDKKYAFHMSCYMKYDMMELLSIQMFGTNPKYFIKRGRNAS